MDELVAAVREERCSPETAALLLAQVFRPQVRVAVEAGRLDTLAEGLVIGSGSSPDGQAELLAAHLHGKHGFTGDADSYYDPDNSYLDRVLDRKRGIPISLAVLAEAVGRRVGVRVELIGFPGHFLARVGGPGGVLIDPFHRFRTVTDEELQTLGQSALGDTPIEPAIHLAPVGVRPLVVRMLLNLKRCHEGRGDTAQALVACDRLYDLTGNTVFRRDRGLHALSLGAVEAALEDLEAYLVEHSRASDAGEVRTALNRAREAVRPPS